LLKVFAPAYDLNPDAPGVILKTHLGIEDKQRSSIRDCVSTIRGLLSDAVQIRRFNIFRRMLPSIQETMRLQLHQEMP